MALSVVVALCLAAVANAHLCMWQPMQRSDGTNPFTIARPGEHACYHKPPPCGGVAYNPSATPTALVAGAQYTMQFEQNLNHFDAQSPGFLDVSFAAGTNPTDSEFVALSFPLPDFDAMNMITITNFTVSVTVPNAVGQGVMRVRYASNNPGENDQGTTFHQCADVLISAAPGPNPPAATAKPAPAKPSAPVVTSLPVLPHFKRLPVPTAAPTGCCTARQFTMMAQESGGYRNPTRSTIYYDAVRQQMRIDTVSGSGQGSGMSDGSFQTFLNFTGSEVGHLYNVNTGVCDERGNAYGPDPWNDWCYGNSNPSGLNESQSFVESLVIGGTPANVWQTGEMFFVSSADGACTPMLQTRPTTGFTVLYYNFVAGAPDPALFVPPAACNTQQLRKPNAAKSKPLPRKILALRDALLKRH